jgi:cyclopropane-fatty-acyl-phospholipid synthase
MFYQQRLLAWSNGMRRQVPLPLRLELWNGQHINFSSDTPRVTIRVPSRRAIACLLSPSLYKLGRAYVEGMIDVRGKAADMIAVVNALARGANGGKDGSGGNGNGGPLNQRVQRLLGSLGRHSRRRDALAIQYHYDVSNDFYAHWLDPAMVYSCAYFEQGNEDLATAQQKKIDHILAKIALQPGHTLLDIGCGWGALLIRAARRFGVHCVGITLSPSQARLARERVAQAGLQQLIEIRVQDYRDVRGQFDRITSVGMFEHVGARGLPAYFAQLSALLAPGGVVMNHGITTSHPDEQEVPHGGGDFIDRYVFPDGELVHLSTVLKAMQQGGLEVRDVENLRRHYARTCALWTDNFEANAEQIRTTLDARKFRIWHVYLAGCSYAFAHDWISLYQVVCGKAGQDPVAIPWSRRYMYEGSGQGMD